MSDFTVAFSRISDMFPSLPITNCAKRPFIFRKNLRELLSPLPRDGMINAITKEVYERTENISLWVGVLHQHLVNCRHNKACVLLSPTPS